MSSFASAVPPTSTASVASEYRTQPQQRSNGRIPLMHSGNAHPYTFAQMGKPATDAPAARLGSMQQPTILSRTYFSEGNTQILQNALRKRVHDITNTVVEEQNVEQLQLVMRSVFLQYSRNQTYSAEVIRAQVTELNAKVLDYCVPIVVSNLKQYQQYLKDVSTMPTPMEYGLATSQAGSRSLELKPFF